MRGVLYVIELFLFSFVFELRDPKLWDINLVVKYIDILKGIGLKVFFD